MTDCDDAMMWTRMTMMMMIMLFDEDNDDLFDDG